MVVALELALAVVGRSRRILVARDEVAEALRAAGQEANDSFVRAGLALPGTGGLHGREILHVQERQEPPVRGAIARSIHQVPVHAHQ